MFFGEVFLFLTGSAEEGLEEVEGFCGEDVGGYFAVVVEGGGGLEEVDPASSGSGFGVWTAEDDAVGAAVDDGSGAHGAGFFGYVKGATFESPVAELGLGGGEGEDFGVGGGVFEGFDLVGGASDDLAVFDNDGADGDFVGVEGFLGFAESELHEVVV